MANDLDDLDGAKGDPQRRRAASWSSSTSAWIHRRSNSWSVGAGLKRVVGVP